MLRLEDGTVDPLELGRALWPDRRFYGVQRDVIYSVEYNRVTVVPAGNKLGKDFVAGFLALTHFLRYTEARVVTTSVKDDHLRVLWGEIGRFVQSAAVPLDADRGGPLVVNHRDVRKLVGPAESRRECKISYLRGMVSEKGEGMAGHHAAHTLGVIDEASGVDDVVFTQMQTWAQRILVIGNPLPCANFFYKCCKAGDLPIPPVPTGA